MAEEFESWNTQAFLESKHKEEEKKGGKSGGDGLVWTLEEALVVFH